MNLFTKVEKVFHNFYKPAPKDIQRYCAALKAVGGVLIATGPLTAFPWIIVLGLVMAAVGEGWEKLSDSKPVPVSPTGEPAETASQYAA